MEMTGHPIVDAISKMHFEGDITPKSWYKHITYTNKRGTYPDPIAIDLLSDIVYWYRATEIRDEESGHLTGWKKKFKNELLQRSAEAFADQFGYSIKQIRESLKLLQELNLISIVNKPIKTQFGTIPNVTYIGVNPDRLAEITYRVSAKSAARSTEKSLLPNWETYPAELGNIPCRIGKHTLPNSAAHLIYRDYTETIHTEAEPPNPVPQTSPTPACEDLEFLSNPEREELAKTSLEESNTQETLILGNGQFLNLQEEKEGQNKHSSLGSKLLGSDLKIPQNENDSHSQNSDDQTQQYYGHQDYNQRFKQKYPPGKAGHGINDWDEDFVEWRRQEKSKTPYYVQTLKRPAERGDVIKELVRDSRSPEGRAAIAASWETYKTIQAKKTQTAANTQSVTFTEPDTKPIQPQIKLPKLNPSEQLELMKLMASGISRDAAYRTILSNRPTLIAS